MFRIFFQPQKRLNLHVKKVYRKFFLVNVKKKLKTKLFNICEILSNKQLFTKRLVLKTTSNSKDIIKSKYDVVPSKMFFAECTRNRGQKKNLKQIYVQNTMKYL